MNMDSARRLLMKSGRLKKPSMSCPEKAVKTNFAESR